ncbi:CehA/McbA family metallohydrolase [Brachybacterium sp. Z12]|uniref:CehA/McbA family metallohydrolase n=1 Tax=Brachybacterium sp. Z12 TaxID=2759167 RepID=UPI00223BD4FA|nr:CehA/McbA family metallohydrolase [Brachybacterium sp. Z12]
MPAAPLPVTVEIHLPALSPIPPEPLARARAETPRASARALPAAPGLTWLAGDFHSHSTHSDGEQSLDELAALAAGHGLDFLAVTEHNTVSHLPHLSSVGARHGITLLPGQEVTTPRGHANALGDISWVDFRRDPSHWRTQVEREGGLLSVNHPSPMTTPGSIRSLSCRPPSSCGMSAGSSSAPPPHRGRCFRGGRAGRSC